MADHRPGILVHPNGIQAVCSLCGPLTDILFPPTSEAHETIRRAEREHMDAVINPVVAAKIDELVETGNRHGVTPELIEDVISVIGDPRA